MMKFLDPEWKSCESGTSLPSQHLLKCYSRACYEDAQLWQAKASELNCFPKSQLALTAYNSVVAARIHWFPLAMLEHGISLQLSRHDDDQQAFFCTLRRL